MALAVRAPVRLRRLYPAQLRPNAALPRSKGLQAHPTTGAAAPGFQAMRSITP